MWLCHCADHEFGSCVGFCSNGFYKSTNITYEYCGSALGEGSGGNSGGDGGSGDGEGNGGSGTGDGDGNDLPIDGLIITKPEKPELPTPDCNELEKNEENPLFNQFMQELEDNTANGTNEKGFNILNLPATNTEPEEETFVFPDGVVEGTPNKVSLPQNIYRKATAHNHIPSFLGSLKIYSPEDIAILGTILDIQQNNTNAELEVEQLAHYVVTEGNSENEQSTYALKVENANSKLINFSKKYPKNLRDVNNNVIQNPSWNKRLYNNVNKYYEDEINSNFTRTKQIEGFLNLVSKQDLDITLYEKNPVTDNWEKVHLDDNGTVKRTPCNEI